MKDRNYLFTQQCHRQLIESHLRRGKHPEPKLRSFLLGAFVTWWFSPSRGTEPCPPQPVTKPLLRLELVVRERDPEEEQTLSSKRRFCFDQGMGTEGVTSISYARKRPQSVAISHD